MRATIVEDIVAARDTPGAIHWDDEFGQMDFVCPCGCRKIGSISIQPKHPSGWTMRGMREAPIISPSIFFEQGRRGEWHGFLGGADGSRPGEWVSC